MNKTEKSTTLTKVENNIRIESNMEGQELYEALVALIGYVGGHLQDPSQISFVCGTACSDATRLMEEKGIIRRK